MADIRTGASLAEVGEFDLIAAIAERFEQGPLVYVGPGDDAALLRAPRGHVLVSTDLLVENHHFRREWFDARDVGHRAAAQNIADIAAMGGTAQALTVGVAAPEDLPAQWLLDLADGIAAECGLVGASVIGGDLTRAKEITVAVTVLGACEKAPVRRSGARPGDVVALAGRQGWSAAGLAVLGRGFRSPRALVEAYRRPEPPYAAGPAAAAAGATSMIDVSDGLLADAGHIAAASGVRIDVRREAFTLADPMIAVGQALGADPLQFVLGGGEDHSLLATFSSVSDLPEDFAPIGTVLDPDADRAAVTVDGEEYEGQTGWQHF